MDRSASPALSVIQESQVWGAATLLSHLTEGRIRTEPHSPSVSEAKLVAIGLQITLTRVRKNQPGLTCQAPLQTATLQYSRHIRTWLLTQRVRVHAAADSTEEKRNGDRKNNHVPTTADCVNESSSGHLTKQRLFPPASFWDFVLHILILYLS